MTDVQSLLSQFKKDYKKDLTVIGDNPPRLRTNIFALDVQLNGGFPKGRISLIYGPESSGKTSLALKLIAQSQKDDPDKTAVFVDVEGHYSKDWAVYMGVDPDKLVVLMPDNAEQVVDMVESLLYTEDLSVVVVDSLAAMVTVSELKSDAEKAQVGTTGLMINKFYRKTSVALGKAKQEGREPTLILINQTRSKIGVMYGDPETMPGGSAFKFASSLTLRVYGKEEFDNEVSKEIPAFRKVNVIVKKHKISVLSRKSEFMFATIPNPKWGLKIGESYDLASVFSYLKSLELLRKGDPKGWDVVMVDTGEIENFDLQDDIKKRLSEDESFDRRVKDGIITTLASQHE